MKRLVIVLSAITAVTLLLCGTALAYSATIKPVEAPIVFHLNPDVIFTKVNDERVKNGLQPLVRDSRLDTSAQTKADDMFTNNYYAHINPTTGVNGYTLIPNGMCSYKSENLSWNWLTNEGVVSGWLGSKAHHDTILDSRYTLTGVAIHGKIAVQHFCIAK